MEVDFWTLNFLLISAPYARPNYIDYCSFELTFEIGKRGSSNFVLLQYCFNYSHLLGFQMYFKISFSTSAEISIGDCIKSLEQFW